jgi:hypothetical protein
MKLKYTKPEVRCYGTVEHITGTFNLGSDYESEVASKKFAFSHDFRGTMGSMPLPTSSARFDRFSA